MRLQLHSLQEQWDDQVQEHLEGTAHAFANFRCNFVQLCKRALPIFVSVSILTIPLHHLLIAGRQLWAVWIGAEVPRSCPTYRVTVSPDINQHSEPSMSHCCQYENTSKVSTGIKLRHWASPENIQNSALPPRVANIYTLCSSVLSGGAINTLQTPNASTCKPRP